jgi:hypothetical protein
LAAGLDGKGDVAVAAGPKSQNDAGAIVEIGRTDREIIFSTEEMIRLEREVVDEMGIFTKDIKSMEDLLIHGLQDIYYAE